MVSPAVVLIYRVGKHLVMRIHILALKFGPFLFHSPALVLSQCATFLPSMWLPCIFFSAVLSCKASSFPKYLTPKLSNSKVKFIGRLLCFNSPFFFLRGGIHKDLGVLPGSCVISVLLGGLHTVPLLPLNIWIHYVIFLRDYISLLYNWSMRYFRYGPVI